MDETTALVTLATSPAESEAYQMLLARAHRSVVVLEESVLGAVQPGIGTSRLSSLPDLSWHRTRARDGLPHALVASYHVSRQNTQTGRLTAAMFDEVVATALRLAGS